MGRKEFWRSLKTKNIDDPVALDRWQAAKAEYTKIVADARAAAVVYRKQTAGAYDTLDDALVDDLLERYTFGELASDAAARFDPEVKARGELVTAAAERAGYDLPPHRATARWSQGFRVAIETALDVYRGYSADGAVEGIIDAWSDRAASLAASSGYVVDRSTSAFRDLCIRLNETAIGVHEAELKRLDGHIIPTPPAPPEPVKPHRASPQDEALALLDLFDGYAALQGIGPRTRSEWRKYLELFRDFLGHDDARTLTEGDVERWRDHLLATPTRQGAPRKAVTVRDKYLMPIRCTLKYAVVDMKRLSRNVAEGVTVRIPKRTKTRESYFSKEEARAILLASLEAPSDKLSGPSVFARRWVPWLCAYSGARVGELAQLRREDIRKVDGVWVMNVTPEAGTVKTKEARLVPLHDHVIEQGFVTAIDGLSGPLFYAPANRRAEGADVNRHVAKVGERLAKWVRDDVGIKDKELQPNHAWRHLFKTLAEEAGIAERTCDAIMGHSPVNVSRRYGGSTITAKAAAMAAFPRFEVIVPTTGS